MEKSSSSYSPEIGDEKMIFLSGSVQRSIVPCCEYIPIFNLSAFCSKKACADKSCSMDSSISFFFFVIISVKDSSEGRDE